MPYSINGPLSILVRLALYLYLLAQIGICMIYSILSFGPLLLAEPNPAPTLGQQVAAQAPRLLFVTTLLILPTLHSVPSGNRLTKPLLLLATALNAFLSSWALVGFALEVPQDFLRAPYTLLILLANPFILCVATIPALHRAVYNRKKPRSLTPATPQ